MRIITTQTEVFKYDELDDKAKQNVLDYFLETMDDWWDTTYEDAANIGLKITSFNLYPKEIEGELTMSLSESAQAIIKDHGEVCETYKLAKIYEKEWAALIAKWSDGHSLTEVAEGNEYEFDLDADILEKEYKTKLLEEYLILLQQDYDYQISEENIKELIDANEYEFTKEGKLI